MKKVVSFILIIAMMTSVLALTSCDLQSIIDMFGGMGSGTPKRTTITEDEWDAVWTSKNFTLTQIVGVVDMDGNRTEYQQTFMKTETAAKISIDGKVQGYFTYRDGKTYQALQYDGQWIYSETDESFMDYTLEDMGLNEVLTFDKFVYDEESKSYIFEQEGHTAQFFFEDGKLKNSDIAGYYQISNVGTTKIDLPKFRTEYEPEQGENIGTLPPVTTTPPWENTEPEEPEPEYEDVVIIDGLKYTLNGMKDGYWVSVEDGVQLQGHVEILSEICGLPVNEVLHEGFQWQSGITSIVIPDTVTHIGPIAFWYCTSLESVKLSENLTSISYATFGYCSALKSVTIPNSVTEIADKAFDTCESLESVTMSNNVTSIGENAFYRCQSLTSIELPNTLTSIGDYAFLECYALQSITIPESVTSIGVGAFWRCKSLTSIDIVGNNENYKSIDGNLYSKDGTILIQYAIGKQNSAFVIPQGVTNIPDCAFDSADSLVSIEIPDSVQSIGISAFACCLSLESITIPSSVTSIGDYAFYYCSSMNYIGFDGLVEQWNDIVIGAVWLSDVPATEVVCSNGVVSLN